MEVHGYSADDVYVKTVRAVLEQGIKVSGSREGGMRELMKFTYIIDNPEHCLVTNRHRKIDVNYLEAFTDWILSGETIMPQSLIGISPFVKKFDDNRVADLAPEFPDNMSVFYGPRIKKQINDVVDEMCINKNSRRTTISILSNDDHTLLAPLRNEKDLTVEYPCTISMTYFIRSFSKLSFAPSPPDDLLFGQVHMRSNNILMVSPVDMYIQGVLLAVICEMLKEQAYPDLKLGQLSFNCASAHFYESQLELAKKIVQDATDSV